MSKPRVLRKATGVFKAGPLKGRVKIASDAKARLWIEKVKSQMPRNCEGACIWGGTIEVNDYYARVNDGEKRYIGRRLIPATRNYHFSCLPEKAMPLRRFFEPLPYRSTLCLNSTEPVSHRLFHSIVEWEAWMATHYPSMRRDWSDGGPGWRQHGSGYRWCRVEIRTSFRKPKTD